MSPLKESFERALAHHQRGRLVEAEALYRQVLAADSNHFDSLHLLGLCRIQTGEAEQGVALIRRALTVKPGVALAHYNLGNALLTLGHPAEALESFRHALALDPRDALSHFEMGNALKALGRDSEAIASYDEAIRLDPPYAEAHNNRGIALKDAGRLAEAVASYERAIALRSSYAEAHSNRGNALKELFRFEEALAAQDRAISLRPDYPEAHYNRANVLAELKRHDEALAAYDHAIALRPAYAEAQHNKSHLLLGLGRFREGFALYGARWRSPTFDTAPIQTSLPRWDGGSDASDVLLWAEQGIGDEILYASLLALAPPGPRLSLAADKRLHAIYRRSFPGITILDRAAVQPETQGGFTAQVPIGDLGALLAVDAETLRQRPPAFLKADETRREMFRHTPAFLQQGAVVGLAWKSANKRLGAEKSLRLADLAPLLALPGRSFVNLQYGAVSEEIADVRQRCGVTVHQLDGLDVFNDIDGLLAAIAACDVVVTTSNVTAHLAGALGKRAAVLLPAGKGCLWYWQGGSNDLWYPGLTRFACPSTGNWEAAIAAAASWVRDNT